MDNVIPLLPLPTLSPRDLFSRRNDDFFPLNHKHLVTTYLGRNAVWQAMLEMGLPHQEVIVPSYHHGIEVEAMLRAKVIPRFARVDGNGVLDLQHVESLIGPKTRSLYVIHYAGYPQPMSDIVALTKQYGLLLVEDCALSLFSADQDVPLGSFGDASIFCFYKTLPVPHGGGLVLKNQHPREISQRSPAWFPTLSLLAGSTLLHLERQHPRVGVPLRKTLRQWTAPVRLQAFNEVVPVGTQTFDNKALHLGMSAFSKRILHASPARDIVRKRRENFAFLQEAIGKKHHSLWQQLPEGMCPLFYPLRVSNKDVALERFHTEGIVAIDFWRHGHEACPNDRFPESAKLRREIVELPCHQDLTEQDLERIASSARAVLRQTQ